jgi:hypothetical protein
MNGTDDRRLWSIGNRKLNGSVSSGSRSLGRNRLIVIILTAFALGVVTSWRQLMDSGRRSSSRALWQRDPGAATARPGQSSVAHWSADSRLLCRG